MIEKYWKEKRRLTPPELLVREEHWQDQQETFVYYLSYYYDHAIPFQRTPLSDSSFTRKSLPKFMAETFQPYPYYLYCPKPWKAYVRQPLIVVEGIPDTLTWWEVGVPAVGLQNVSIIKNTTCQQHLRELIDYANPTQVIGSPDGDKPNFRNPDQDNVRYWMQHLAEYMPQWLEFRLYAQAEYKLYHDAYVQFWKEQKRVMSIKEDLAWWDQQAWKWPKRDSNDVWREVMDAERFKEAMRSILVEMPNLVPKLRPKPKQPQQVYSLTKGRLSSFDAFIASCQLPGLHQTSNRRWWRAFCPVEHHKREGNRIHKERGTLGICEGDYRVVFRCNAGCAEEDVLSVLGLTLEDITYSKR